MNTEIKILLVEDEFLIALSLKEGLGRKGYNNIETVASGEKAIDAAKKLSPDIILMDIRLSGEMDGITAAEKIRLFSRVPIVFMTGYSNSEILNRIKVFTPYGFLTKPVSIFNLNNILDDIKILE